MSCTILISSPGLCWSRNFFWARRMYCPWRQLSSKRQRILPRSADPAAASGSASPSALPCCPRRCRTCSRYCGVGSEGISDFRAGRLQGYRLFLYEVQGICGCEPEGISEGNSGEAGLYLRLMPEGKLPWMRLPGPGWSAATSARRRTLTQGMIV